MPEMETEDTRESIEELSTIFSNANFPWEVENRDNQAADEDEIDLAIGKYVLEIIIFYVVGISSSTYYFKIQIVVISQADACVLVNFMQQLN